MKKPDKITINFIANIVVLIIIKFFLQDIVKKPVLVSKHNKNFFIKQGLLEDCWFVVGMINLYQQKALFSFAVPGDQSFSDKKYAGIFHFR